MAVPSISSRRFGTHESMSISPLKPHSCKYCEEILLDFRKVEQNPAQDVESTKECLPLLRIDCSRPGSSSKLATTALLEASKDGCMFCSFLIDIDPQQVATLFSWDTVAFGDHPHRLFFSIATDLRNPASKHIKTRPVNPQTASAKSFQPARQWFAECLKSHTDCVVTSANLTFKPTRLVEIVRGGPDWHVRLHRPCVRVNYTALSYCWGGHQTFLTRESEREWESAIAWERLPKTIQDAIVVTKELNLQHIWVDALCIAQDDPGEISFEISKMSQVYGSAAVTIAASTSKGACEGFLQDRKVTNFPNDVFQLPVRCANGEKGTAVLFRARTRDRRTPEPLNDRAWTLQERYLSPRILEFNSLQLRWTCPTTLMSDWKESGAEGTEYFDGWFGDIEDAVPLAESNLEVLEGWHRLVYSYTLRKLTVPTDRILAISGIAESFGSQFGDEYYAGLWCRDLPIGLQWKSWPLTTDFSKPFSGQLEPRPVSYQGPSWSWVSVNVLATFQAYEFPVEPVLEISGCDITLADPRAPYGAVESGQLHVQGRVRPAVLMHTNADLKSAHRKADFAYPRHEWKLQMRDRGEVDEGQLYAEVDALEPEFTGSGPVELPVYLLEVLRHKDNNNNVVSEGLILRKLRNRHYSRVGTFSFYKILEPGNWSDQCRWFKQSQSQGITII